MFCIDSIDLHSIESLEILQLVSIVLTYTLIVLLYIHGGLNYTVYHNTKPELHETSN